MDDEDKGEVEGGESVVQEGAPDELPPAVKGAGLTVGDVAKASGASIRLLQKNFRAVTGVTVSETIQTARLRRVCSLLSETSTPIGRIAELCGFGDDAHLKKLFRRRFRCTMRDWRNGRRQPDDELS